MFHLHNGHSVSSLTYLLITMISISLLDVSGDDPTYNPRPGLMLDGSNSTMNGMLMGAIVTAPLPEYPDDHIPP